LDEFLYENIKNTTGKVLDYCLGTVQPSTRRVWLRYKASKDLLVNRRGS
jgi:hypothetical protein